MTYPIIALWAHPRSRSTALERIMIERGDLEVIHEPFSELYYVKEKRANAVGSQIDENQARNYEAIRDDLLERAGKQPIVFKDMCYHCLPHLMRDEAFLQRIRHAFLIREPAATIASHFAKNPEVTNEEIGYETEWQLFDRVNQMIGLPPVIDADDLLVNAEPVIEQFFERLDLVHQPDALKWQAGHRPEWDSWKDWHVEVSETTGMEDRKRDYKHNVENTPRLAEFFDYHRPFYDRLRAHRIIGT